MKKYLFYIILALMVLGAIGAFLYFNKGTQNGVNREKTEVKDENIYEKIYVSEIANSASEFNFSAEVPREWAVESVPEIEALNFYYPLAQGNGSLENSQIFVRHFEANSFLTLATVNILEREKLEINGRLAVRYFIEKKAGITNFSSQPSWRNEKHTVTDIRMSDKNPSVFLVIAKNPELDEATYQYFLNSIKLNNEVSIFEPVKEFKERITKKSFGAYITPETSPVQSERFRGYHTGLDVEYEDTMEEIEVFSIAQGIVVTAKSVSGYGGVLVIRHNINLKEILTLYGHLDPKSLLEQGSTVSRGQKIGTLGEGGTSETDGERKHLHFAMLKGDNIDFRGYVQIQEELYSWYNPLDFFN